jgi:hypothetical protein
MADTIGNLNLQLAVTTGEFTTGLRTAQGDLKNFTGNAASQSHDLKTRSPTSRTIIHGRLATVTPAQVGFGRRSRNAERATHTIGILAAASRPHNGLETNQRLPKRPESTRMTGEESRVPTERLRPTVAGSPGGPAASAQLRPAANGPRPARRNGV